MQKNSRKKAVKPKPFFSRNEKDVLRVFFLPRKTLSELWRKGTSSCYNVNFRRLAFVLGGKRGKGQKKGIVVEASQNNGEKVFVYYPKPREALRFMVSVKHLASGGYADRFPGCVGGLSSRTFTEHHPWAAKVFDLQGAFNLKKSPEISQALTSKHGGWRAHVLRKFFEQAVKGKIEKVCFVKPSVSKQVTAERVERQVKSFFEAAKKHGFRQTESENENQVVVLREYR